MPWNEPGNKNNDSWNKGPDQGPPDLDEVLRKLNQRFAGLFGGGRGGGGSGNDNSGAIAGLGLVAIVVVVLWLLMGFYVVSEGQRGVVKRLGQFAEVTTPGLRWHLPWPIEEVSTVDVGSERTVENRSMMLTKDENIVDVKLSVRYRVSDPVDYLFNVYLPDAPAAFQSQGTIFQVMESSFREMIGKSEMDYILGEGRAEIQANTADLMQSVLDEYGTGLLVLGVNLEDAQPPSQVASAFEDAIKAREDAERFINEAEAYSNSVLPQARGEAARISEEAIAYRDRLIAISTGEADRFTQLLKEYRKSPQVTRERLYLETVEEVMGNSSKVVVDVKGGNNMMYLPLDKIINQQMNSPSSSRSDVPRQQQSSPSSGVVEPSTRSGRSSTFR